jgi:hypothetical protein
MEAGDEDEHEGAKQQTKPNKPTVVKRGSAQNATKRCNSRVNMVLFQSHILQSLTHLGAGFAAAGKRRKDGRKDLWPPRHSKWIFWWMNTYMIDQGAHTDKEASVMMSRAANGAEELER